MKHSYTYKTEVDKKGNIIRYRCWVEYFKDADTGEQIPIRRRVPIKHNGMKIVFYSSAQLRRMTPQQREAIKIKP